MLPRLEITIRVKSVLLRDRIGRRMCDENSVADPVNGWTEGGGASDAMGN